MQAVLSQTDISDIVKFWQRLVPAKGGDQPWLFYHGDKQETFSWKDLKAQSHCLAAHLMQRGIRAGDRVAILSSASPFYMVVDFALQYLGAVNITVPESVKTQELEEVLTKESVKACFVEDPKRFNELNQLRSFRNRLTEIILKTDDAEGIFPERLITMDIAIRLGKIVWRENREELEEMKKQVKPDMLYSINCNYPKQPAHITFKVFLEKTEKQITLLKEHQVAKVVSINTPDSFLHRLCGYYATLESQLPAIHLDQAHSKLTQLQQHAPQALILSKEQLDSLYTQTEALFLDAKGLKKSFVKGKDALMQRYLLLKKGEKVPFKIRSRYNSFKRGALSKIKKQFGGQLKVMLVDGGQVPDDLRLFFEETGCKILSF